MPVKEPGWGVRRLAQGDADSFRTLRLEALRQDPDAFGSTYDSEAADPPERFRRTLADGRVFGLFRAGSLVGMAGYAVRDWPKSRHKGGVWGTYVRPSERGKGGAEALMRALIAAAAAEVEILQLKVVSGNAAARGLYEKLGFAQYGLEKRALKQSGRYDDEILMALELAPFSGQGGS